MQLRFLSPRLFSAQFFWESAWSVIYLALIGVLKRLLFLVAAAGLLIPVVETGTYANLTWADQCRGFVTRHNYGCHRVARAPAPAAIENRRGSEGFRPRLMPSEDEYPKTI